MKSKRQSAQGSGPLARAEPWARGSPGFPQFPLYLSPNPSQKNCRNCFWSKWSFERSWSGNSRVSKVLLSFPAPQHHFPNLRELGADSGGHWPQGRKELQSPVFPAKGRTGGGGDRGKDGREREVELGEEAVLNSSHLINLHR